MTEWRFPSNDHGENKGINESGVSTFRGSPLSSLAREICQNSLDAALESEESRVRVVFDMFTIQTSSIPGRDQLLDAFQRCLEFWGTQKSGTTQDYFNKALDTIKAEDCVCLRISDFNTTGLTGSTERINSDWTNLTKSSGASDKKGTAGGSYGIGKYAPFACSDLLTVFYSTYDCHEERACQGVARLVTFTRSDGEDTQGIGYYGNEQNTPIFGELSLDPTFKRNPGEHGTDVYILGYKYGGDDWKKELLVSVLDGFLGALWRDQLIVEIGDLVVERKTLEKLITTYNQSITKYTSYYYKTLTSPETVWFREENFNNMGEIELGLRLFDEPDAPKRVAMIRKTGMKIIDRGNLPGAFPFAGVMFINGEAINRKLREIENPEHTKWEPNRATKPMLARALIKSINDFVKTKIEELINSDSNESIDAVGIGAFLPDIEDGDNSDNVETLSDKVVDVEIKPVKAKIKRKNNANDGVEDSEVPNDTTHDPEGEEEAWFHPGGHTEHKGYRPGQEAHPGSEEKSKGLVRKLVQADKVVCLCQNRDEGKYIIKVTPTKSFQNAEMEIYLSAETQRYVAPVKQIRSNNQELECQGNIAKGLKLELEKELVLNIELDYYDYCSMEVLLYAIEK